MPFGSVLLRRTALAIAVMVIVAGCHSKSPYGPTPLMMPDELAEQLDTETAPLILDVRTVGEYNQGHIPGAVNIPHYLLDDRMDEVLAFKDREVVVLCEVGVRAREAEDYLRSQGFTDVKHLAGDMVRWRVEQLPQTR